jgi:hypothetical protein
VFYSPGQWEAVVCRRDHRGCSSPDDGTDHRITWVVHVGMHARVGDAAGEQSQRYGQAWDVTPDGVREREGRCGVARGK